MFKVNNKNTRTFIVIFEHTAHPPSIVEFE